MATGARPLSSKSLVMRNIKCVQYKKTTHSTAGNGIALVTVGNLVFVACIKYGCQVYKVTGGDVQLLTALGEQPSEKKGKGARASPSGGCSCYSLTASHSHIAYIQEGDAGAGNSLCIHRVSDIIAGKTKPISTIPVSRRAPVALDSDLGVVAIGGLAWTSSWTSGGKGADAAESSECNVRVIDIHTTEEKADWKVVDTAVSILRTQATKDHNMLGVADSRAGLKVFDLRQPVDGSYVCLYQVPVDEIRNFDLAGDCVAVFHKFESNISFWNMNQQKTILCINIQDQMRQMAEELEDDDDDSGLFDDEDDHVTCVTSLNYDDDFLLVYGTRSGCILGMAVQSRTKVFSIPFPYETTEEEQRIRRDVLGLSYISGGQIVAYFENYGLTVLDFTPENPPDRPPTRSGSTLTKQEL